MILKKKFIYSLISFFYLRTDLGINYTFLRNKYRWDRHLHFKEVNYNKHFRFYSIKFFAKIFEKFEAFIYVLCH